MKLELKRLERTEKSTIGELYVNGKFECYTLEDVERKEKVFGETAIDKGTYQVVVTYSNAFKQNMPLLLNVPKFQGIRIHSGNTANFIHSVCVSCYTIKICLNFLLNFLR